MLAYETKQIKGNNSLAMHSEWMVHATKQIVRIKWMEFFHNSLGCETT